MNIESMHSAEVNALIEGCTWPPHSPCAPFVGRRGTKDERRAALLAAMVRIDAAAPNDDARAILASYADDEPTRDYETVTLERVDKMLRDLAFARLRLDPSKPVGAHLVDIGSEVLNRCEAWAEMPDELTKQDPHAIDPDDVPF